MENIDDLKRKKEYLELQKEVAALERNARINKIFDILSHKAIYKSTISIFLFLFGLFLIVGGVSGGVAGAAIAGFILIIPFILKFFSRKE